MYQRNCLQPHIPFLYLEVLEASSSVQLSGILSEWRTCEYFVSRCDPHGRFTPDDTGGAAPAARRVIQRMTMSTELEY